MKTSRSTARPDLLPWLIEHDDEIDALLLDVDGVLMTARRPLPGSEALLDWIRQRRKPFALITNDGCNSPAEKLARLAEGGLHFDPTDIVSSGHALEETARRMGWRGRTFFIMGVLGDPCYAENAGISPCRDIERIENCTGVLVGEKQYDWESVITAVFNFLIRHPDAPLVVPNPDLFFAVQNGGLHPASGATAEFVAMLCRGYGRQVEPLFLGKPYEPIFTHAHNHLERRAGRKLLRDKVMIVGDSLTSDIEGGHRFGYRTALMLTGVTEPPMLATAAVPPDLVCGRIG